MLSTGNRIIAGDNDKLTHIRSMYSAARWDNIMGRSRYWEVFTVGRNLTVHQFNSYTILLLTMVTIAAPASGKLFSKKGENNHAK